MGKKKFIFIIFVLLSYFFSAQQIPEGKVVIAHINAKMLQNKIGENTNRRVSVYLPPGYDKTSKNIL